MTTLWLGTPAGQQATGAFIDDTLKERAAEKGLLGKVPLAANFPRQRVEVVKAIAKLPGSEATSALQEDVQATEKDVKRPWRVEAKKGASIMRHGADGPKAAAMRKAAACASTAFGWPSGR